LCCAAFLGCKEKEKVYEQKGIAPIDQAKTVLQNYAEGKPMTSEVTTFPDIVEGVRKTDPAKADILEKGFADLQKNKDNLAPRAKELLKKL